MDAKNNIELLIKLNVTQWNYILQALQELPAKIANPINNLIVDQANEQLKAREEMHETIL